MDVPGYFAERAPLVDAQLDAILPQVSTPPESLHAAMRHLVFPGGKRLRPALAFATAEALGRPPERVLPVAAAVELVHTYSLIHDDLPCMDDDDERRGQPTVHRQFDEATAVLAGDALQALAFEALALPTEAAPSAVLASVRDLAGAIGAAGLVGGQVDDLAFAQDVGGAKDARQQRVESIHRRKSARLIAAAMSCAARFAGGDDRRVDNLCQAGLEMGVAFQIADDWLDRDEDEGCSLVHVLGSDAARERANVLLQSALARVEELGDAAESLRALMRFAVHRTV
jgi:geranylgeranyl pyrophosphate synthase